MRDRGSRDVGHFGQEGEFRLAIDLPEGFAPAGAGSGRLVEAPLFDLGVGMTVRF